MASTAPRGAAFEQDPGTAPRRHVVTDVVTPPVHTISLLVRNKPGVLVRVSLVFSRRGYNMESLTAYSAVLGWELTRNVRLRAEYTHQRIKMVDGVTQDITDEAKHPDYFDIEVGAGF